MRFKNNNNLVFNMGEKRKEKIVPIVNPNSTFFFKPRHAALIGAPLHFPFSPISKSPLQFGANYPFLPYPHPYHPPHLRSPFLPQFLPPQNETFIYQPAYLRPEGTNISFPFPY